MATPSEKFKFRANAPAFIPRNIQRNQEQLERNKRRNQALGVAMLYDPTLISSLGPSSKAQHPLYNPNIKSAYKYFKEGERITNIVNTYNDLAFPSDALAEIERILCKGVRIPSDVFGEILNKLIQSRQLNIVRRILDCDEIKRKAKDYYRHAESFNRNASTLYHYLDDSMLDIAERLYQIGIDINYQSDSKPSMYSIGVDTIPNYTPLEQSIINVQPELVKFFVSHGATLPTNPDSLFRAIYPIEYRILMRRIEQSKINPNYIRDLQSSIESIYTLVPSLKETLNVLIITRDIPSYPIEKKTILTRLNGLLRIGILRNAPSYIQMINYFITKISADGAIERSETEQRGASRKWRHSRRHIKTKRSRRILTRRLK